MTNIKKVAILYGGRSVEHGVSVNSAKNIFEYIDKSRFEVLPIGISKTGQWFLTTGVTKDVEQGKAIGLILDAKNPGLTLLSSGDRLKADIVFPVLHGTDGEDGSIQGMVKAIDLPMVGTGVLGSALSMNKIVAKQLLAAAELPVTRFLSYTHADRQSITFKRVKTELGMPFMVKSASLGSSVGVSKVSKEDDFEKAVDEAFRYDDKILFEEYIQGREIECAILGNNLPEASLPGEIIISKSYAFYTFDAKYVDGEAVTIEVPAKLKAKISDRVRALSIEAYKTLYCEDFARVDLFVDADENIYINEINTIPGFTNSSMYPMMWKERGVSFTELISKLIDLAEERFEKNSRIERDFQSSLKF